MRYALFLIAFAVALSLVSCPARGQGSEALDTEPFSLESNRPFNFWMDVKLKKSQDIFAALTAADYERIVENTKQLRTLSELEGFVRKGVPDYLTQLRSFRFAVDEIEKQARQENIEGVTLGFQQLTLSCMHCHNALRSDAAAPKQTK